MITLVLFLLLSVGTQATPEVCYGMMCGTWKTFGLTYNRSCTVTDENRLLILPPGLADSAQQCESLSKDSVMSGWYTYRPDGSCELLSHCTESYIEEGSVTGPDPGEGETCFAGMTTTPGSTTTQPTTTPEPTTTPTPPQEVLLVIGGYPGPLSSVNIITEDIKVISGAIPDVPVADYRRSAGHIDGQVVVSGGVSHRAECQHFNLSTKAWETTSKMAGAWYDPVSVVYDGIIYMFGGYNSGTLASVERYHSALNTWSNIPEWTLPEANRLFCAVVHNEYIYFLGGLGISDGSVMRRLSTISNEYETMPPMLGPRYAHTCVVDSINGEAGILVSGGNNGTKYLDSTEFYSFQGQKWHKLENMNQARGYHGMGIIKGKPVVFGGYTGDGLDSLEVYEDKDHKWHLVVDATLTDRRSHFAYVKIPQWSS